MPVTITKHAQQCLKKRVGLNKKALQRAAETAYAKGIRHQETTGNLKKWVTSLYFNNQAANNIRLYNGKAWIFAEQKLITVIQVPASLQDSLREMSERKKNRHMCASPGDNPDAGKE